MQWWDGEREALREAIHNNHSCFADGQDCCELIGEYEVCAAHSLLEDERVVEAMTWLRRIYWVCARKDNGAQLGEARAKMITGGRLHVGPRSS